MPCTCNGTGWVGLSRWHEDEQGRHEEVGGLQACSCDQGGNLALAAAEAGFMAFIPA
jgi:hypothetical protein